MAQQVDPARWPPNSPTVAVFMWLVWLGVCLAAPILTWTAIPAGGAIAWRRAGHGPVAIASWVVPLAAVLGLLQAGDSLRLSPLADQAWTVGLLVAAGVTMTMVFDHGVQLRWLMLLPSSSLTQPWTVRLEVRRFEQATIAANRVVAQAQAGAGRDLLVSRTEHLLSRAERHAASSLTWQAAWQAHMEWLRALEDAFANPDPPVDVIARTQERVALLDAAIEAAAVETRAIDPLGVSVEMP
jgi:hypothetical protein